MDDPHYGTPGGGKLGFWQLLLLLDRMVKCFPSFGGEGREGGTQNWLPVPDGGGLGMSFQQCHVVVFSEFAIVTRVGLWLLGKHEHTLLEKAHSSPQLGPGSGTWLHAVESWESTRQRLLRQAVG